MKLYTRTGDDGTTGLFGGGRTAKDGLRVEAYGTVDELSSFVGCALAACGHSELSEMLITLQHQLFELGADLATPSEQAPDRQPPRIGRAQVELAERLIDQLCAPLPAMKHFVLPGGSELAARLHVARTVCRRAERCCLSLSRQEPIGEHVVPYLNRLSDLFFAAARRANQLEGVDDVPWRPEK